MTRLAKSQARGLPRVMEKMMLDEMMKMEQKTKMKKMVMKLKTKKKKRMIVWALARRCVWICGLLAA